MLSAEGNFAKPNYQKNHLADVQPHLFVKPSHDMSSALLGPTFAEFYEPNLARLGCRS